MHKVFTSFVVLFVLFCLGAGSILAQEVEPNDTFKNATPLLDNTEPWAEISSSEDVDIYKIVMSTDSIYHIYSDSSDLPENLAIEMFFEADTTTNILHGDPAGRAGWGDFRIAGWVPFEYGPGVYYIKVSHPQPITGEFTGKYKIRLISQNLNFWANLHEPDNTFQESFGQFALPVDGTRFNGMLFDLNAPPTGQDDIDIFYMAGEQGKRLWVETEPVQGYPHTRDMDSKIYVWDGDGTQLLVDNDDKSNQEEDFGANNVFSLCVLDSLPYTGLYYVIITSYYAAYNNDGVSRHSDEDPSTGGYVAYAWMGESKQEVEPNNTPEQATPICEGISGQQVGGNNNLIIDAMFESDGDVDCYAVNLKTTKMYSFNTANSSVGGDIMVEVYSQDDLGTNLIDDSVEGKYNSNDFRLSGWIPPKNGVYIVKLTPAAGSIGGENTGEYQFRMGWATWRRASLIGEPDNDDQIASETNQVAIDSSMNYAAIYPAGDVDWFWFDGNAGDIIHVETFSGLDFDGTWGRDLDTKIAVIDPSGNVVENDDFRPDDGSRHPGNTFSAVKDYTLQGTGTVWIKVQGYYDEMGPAGKNPIGTYRLFVYSSAAAPEFAEKESNDLFKLAMKLPEDKEVKAKFSKGGSPSADDVDIYAIDMVTTRMYFVNSTESEVAEDIHAELYAASDTTTNILDSDIDGRYKSNDFRLAGFIPPEDGVYYLKLTCPAPGQGTYTIRARSTAIDEVAPFHEPDNTLAEADARGDYPIDGVAQKGALYNEADPKKANDLDIFRFSCVAGQMLVAEVTPVGGETWFRDTDTKMTLVNAAGDTVASNDDNAGTTYSKVAYEVPEDGVYYLYLYGYYSAANGKETSHEDPGVGDYLLTVSGTMSEVEPNNTPDEATMIPIANNNLIEASFSAEDLVDWYKVSLEAGHLYYFNTTESRVGEDIQVEVYSVDDPATNLIDNTGWGRFNSGDFRLSAWQPPASGDYLLKLTVPVGAIDAQNTGKYKLRAAGGEALAEVAAIHEPDNTIAEAQAQAALSSDGTAFMSAFGDDGDHDLFVFEGVQGKKAEITLAPAHGPRWIREVDTYLAVLTADSILLGTNDDYDDWYEINFYQGEVSCTYSQVVIDSLPYTGSYFVHALPYYGTFRGKEPSIGNNAMGSYLVSVSINVPTDVEDEEEEQLPTDFALDQNYPNPFNPSTTIQYSLKEPVDVRITIFNIMGQKVATLVDQKQAAGRYSLLWNATDDYGRRVSSGIYFYRINAGDKFISTKKMMLLK